MKDYVEKLANNIEQVLDMSRSEIQELSDTDFRNLLRHGYFVKKPYKDRQTEPTDRQMDVLNLYYGKYKPTRAYYTSYSTREKIYIDKIRQNSTGRWIDAKTGKYIHKQ